MNELISRLKKMHGEWLKNSQLAMAATQDEQKAKCIAADKFSVQLMEMLPEIVRHLQDFERLVNQYTAEERLKNTIDRLITEKLKERVKDADDDLIVWLENRIKEAVE